MNDLKGIDLPGTTSIIDKLMEDGKVEFGEGAPVVLQQDNSELLELRRRLEEMKIQARCEQLEMQLHLNAPTIVG